MTLENILSTQPCYQFLLLERKHHLTGHCVDVPILGLLLIDIVDIVHIVADKRNQLESHSCIIVKRFSDMCFYMYCFASVLTRQMRWLLTIMWKFHSNSNNNNNNSALSADHFIIVIALLALTTLCQWGMSDRCFLIFSHERLQAQTYCYVWTFGFYRQRV